MRKVAALSFIAMLVATPAVASTDTAAFEKSGLAGKWAYDCSKPASDKNYVDTWSIADGAIVLASGSGKGDVNPIKIPSFGASKDGKIFYSVAGNLGVLTVELLIEAKRYRLWSSEDVMPMVGGEVYIADGTVKGGGETPWYTKCD